VSSLHSAKLSAACARCVVHGIAMPTSESHCPLIANLDTWLCAKQGIFTRQAEHIMITEACDKATAHPLLRLPIDCSVMPRPHAIDAFP